MSSQTRRRRFIPGLREHETPTGREHADTDVSKGFTCTGDRYVDSVVYAYRLLKKGLVVDGRWFFAGCIGEGGVCLSDITMDEETEYRDWRDHRGEVVGRAVLHVRYDLAVIVRYGEGFRYSCRVDCKWKCIEGVEVTGEYIKNYRDSMTCTMSRA